MKILLITHYFPPEIGAPSARLFEMAKYWVKHGHDVTVLTGFPNHPTGVIPEEYRGYRYLEESMEGIRVLRSYVYATPNEGFIKKTIGHLSFMFSSVIQSFKKTGDIDIIVVSSPTFFSIFSAYFYSIIKRRKLIVEIRDLWPAAIVELGVLKNRFIIGVLEKLELFFYKKSSQVVVVTDSFKENLKSRSIPENKIKVITNGVESEVFKPLIHEGTQLRQQLGVDDNFVILYIGAHGISQSLDRIIDVAKSLLSIKEITFLFVGEGAEKNKLVDRVANEGITNVKFLSGQPKEKVPQFYAASDMCIVPLKNIPLFETFIPSKIFEIMSCEKPIVASLSGETEKILQKSGSAIVVPPEDVELMKEAILKLKSDPKLKERLGRSGRIYVEEHYSREGLAEKYINILEEAVLGG